MSIWALPIAFRMSSRTGRKTGHILVKIQVLFSFACSNTPLKLTLLEKFVLLCISLHVLAPALHPLHLCLQKAQEELPISHAGRGSARVGQAAGALDGWRPRPGSLRRNGQRSVGTRRQVWGLVGPRVGLADL